MTEEEKMEFIENLEKKRNQLSDKDMVKYDILLTESFEKLASRIAAKLSDPNELQNWKSHLQAVGFKLKQNRKVA